MTKTVWDKKTKSFVKREFIALCNSKECAHWRTFKVGSYAAKNYDLFKFSKKEVRPGSILCPDCGHALLWKQEPVLLP